MHEYVAHVNGLRIVHKICVRKPEGKKRIWETSVWAR